MTNTAQGFKTITCLFVLPLLLGLGACSSSDSNDPDRQVVAIANATVTNAGLILVVDSCHGDPVAEVSESESDVRISVTSTVFTEGDACQESLDVPLEKRLGDRVVIDLSNNSEVQMIQ